MLSHFSRPHGAPCIVIETRSLWGEDVCRIWLPDRDETALVARADVCEIDDAPREPVGAAQIAWAAAAARVNAALEDEAQRALLAPLQAGVTPLPHQLDALRRAMSGERVRYMLADEVGLGKTIEAGLILRELKLRGRAARVLVVAPKSLAQQWVAEMRTHFGEEFRLVQGEDIAALQRTAPDASAWRMFDQVIVTLDSVKPIERRRGWSDAQIAAWNRTRFEELVAAGWDLVIIDEAHRLGGGSDAVARHQLGRALAEATPHLLLLTATPHQGKSDAFLRLMRLLDEAAFPDEETISRERVRPYVIRTEKRCALDADGRPLFKPRRTELAAVEWQGRHAAQRALYEAVTEYVRRGYDQALRAQDRSIGFLMILMQRLVVSSTRAIRTTLERRLAVLDGQQARADAGMNAGEQEMLFGIEDEPIGDELVDLDGQQLLDRAVGAPRTRADDVRREREEVRLLAAHARDCEVHASDAKAEALFERILQLQTEENQADLKVLIFTEFVPTQRMLCEFLQARGISTVELNGSMDLDERRRAQEKFRSEVRVLVSTDAGGEGLNLQFCHVVVNYDLPWNPMRIEQRIGRVDRIGQPHVVRAVNFALRDTVEHRVREVLEAKLAVILREFGIDKTGDVLDSAREGELYEGVFAAALQDPTDVERVIERGVNAIAGELRAVRDASPLRDISDVPDMVAAREQRSSPLPHWIARAQAAAAAARGALLPDEDAALNPPRPVQAPAAAVRVDGFGVPLDGAWGLFEVRLNAARPSRAFVPVYVDANGRSFPLTAQRLWEHLTMHDCAVGASLRPADAAALRAQLHAAAERDGRTAYDALRARHAATLERDAERMGASFAGRRRAIARLGLPEVRAHRSARLDDEEHAWRVAWEAARTALPELTPLLALKVVGLDLKSEI
jgi:superfamily II DNA or RNA helicase